MNFVNSDFAQNYFKYPFIVSALQKKLNRGEQTRKMPRLWHLCVDGKLDEVRSALAGGEDVNDKDSIGWTALMRAVWNQGCISCGILVSGI